MTNAPAKAETVRVTRIARRRARPGHEAEYEAMLREMFASAGIELGQTNVSAESFKQSTTEQGSHSNRTPENGSNGILATSAAASATTGIYASRQGNGLVDIFA